MDLDSAHAELIATLSEQKTTQYAPELDKSRVNIVLFKKAHYSEY